MTSAKFRLSTPKIAPTSAVFGSGVKWGSCFDSLRYSGLAGELYVVQLLDMAMDMSIDKNRLFC